MISTSKVKKKKRKKKLKQTPVYVIGKRKKKQNKLSLFVLYKKWLLISYKNDPHGCEQAMGFGLRTAQNGSLVKSRNPLVRL